MNVYILPISYVEALILDTIIFRGVNFGEQLDSD